ncbi:MAG: hypothetical protein A2032_07320 [Chloroflexi bacterium RBG_19FT_COMBO_49_13]|nr:MAG: hypothetical protein A2032_07320 [Chloroflexi bacterium RBG_19FT_COMBO_49_13]
MATRSSRPSPLIISLLVLFSLSILIFLGMLINFIQHPSTTTTITSVSLISTLTFSPSPAPINTSTITLTPRPTWTLRPSATATDTPTPSPTITPTLIRTITPAKPALLNDRYELKPWDLSEQARTLELLHANTILVHTGASFRTLAYAEGEAHLRFPEALDATRWRWDRAFNLLRVQDTQAMSAYIGLISSGISSGQVRSSDLPNWFSQNESRFTLQISSSPPLPGELGRKLIEISGQGSAFFWLVESPTGVSIYPLINDIDFDQPHENAYLYDDLTGDNTPDLVIYRPSTPGNTLFLTPHIFDLSVLPPAALPIQEQNPIDFGLEPFLSLETRPAAGGGKELQVTTILLPACPAYMSQTYTWNEDVFEVSPLQYQLVPVSELLAYCEIILDTASAGWGPDAAITVITPLLEVWPPENDIQGHPFPLDAHDQLSYRLGVLYALAGQPAEAIQHLTGVVNSPSVPSSRWVTPAQQFILTYQHPQDLFTACQQAQFCNLRDALRTMVKTSDLEDPSQVIAYLQNNGIALRSSGLFDFDADGQDERWMIIQPQAETKLEFWILSRMLGGVQAIFVQVFESDESSPYFHEPAGVVPVVQFELHTGFVFHRLLDTQEAYIQWVDVEYARPTIILDGFIQALNALMDGADPASVRETLLGLMNSPRFKGDCIAFNICDQFHYTLGLVYDLLGEGGNAIDEYLWVWRNYGNSPYALMTRLKLNYFPLPTYTKSPVPSRTPTRTRTPSSATPTSTRTVTPIRTNTPTYTLTPTVTPTPSYTITPSETPTSTITPTDTETSTPTTAP